MLCGSFLHLNPVLTILFKYKYLIQLQFKCKLPLVIHICNNDLYIVPTLATGYISFIEFLHYLPIYLPSLCCLVPFRITTAEQPPPLSLCMFKSSLSLHAELKIASCIILLVFIFCMTHITNFLMLANKVYTSGLEKIEPLQTLGKKKIM